MNGKTDFFELPVGDQHHRECIEIEHTDEYRRAYNDGVESFRPKFDEMKAIFDQKIAELSRENEILKNPQCEQCDSFEFGMCQHYRSRDCYLYHRGGTVSLFKIKVHEIEMFEAEITCTQCRKKLHVVDMESEHTIEECPYCGYMQRVKGIKKNIERGCDELR